MDTEKVREMMKLEEIGFYTLLDGRARQASMTSPLWRCELILTDKCNFNCTYCRGLRKDCRGVMPFDKAEEIIELWLKETLLNIRLSGGEPTLWSHLDFLIRWIRKERVKRIAISTNGSADLDYYKELIDCGVNDFSISLDACCALDGKRMNGEIEEVWEKTVENIRELSKLTYVTVGMVFTEESADKSREQIEFAHNLGVNDIRIISSAQHNKAIQGLDDIDQEILDVHPILKYRVNNFRQGRNVRGIQENDCHQCYLVLDDMAIAGNLHFPCIIYLREGGKPIGNISSNMRQERHQWFMNHNSYKDLICRKNCLDVCIDYNNRANYFLKLPIHLNGGNFDWSKWRHGTPLDLGLQCRSWDLLSDRGQKILREHCIGWCRGEETMARPKENHIALLMSKNNEEFWFHVKKNEFKETFPELKEELDA